MTCGRLSPRTTPYPRPLVAPVSPSNGAARSPVPVQVAPPCSGTLRLTQRGVLLTHTTAVPGWRVVRAEYRDVAQSQGRHHIYVDVLDENGVRGWCACLCAVAGRAA